MKNIKEIINKKNLKKAGTVVLVGAVAIATSVLVYTKLKPEENLLIDESVDNEELNNEEQIE